MFRRIYGSWSMWQDVSGGQCELQPSRSSVSCFPWVTVRFLVRGRAELRNLAVTHDPQGFANVVAVVGPTATRCEWCGGTGIQTWQALIAGAGHAGGFLSNPGIHGSHPEFATLITSGFHTQMALNYPSICVNKSGTRIRLDDWIGKFIWYFNRFNIQ